MPLILLNPGPVTLSRRVREAMLRPDLCHREHEFAELQDDVRRKLVATYTLDPATWAAVLLTGSGTAAVEAMLTSLVPAKGRVLIVENGVYGERMTRIAHAHGIDHECVSSGWGEPIDLSGIEQTLLGSHFTHIAVVHHETTSGRLNDIPRLAELATAHGARLLLDGVSSFGAEEIDFDGWHLDACAATANKCLHGVPGAAFVLLRRAALPVTPARTVYLDLATYLARQDDWTTPFTQSVQSFYALDEALNEHVESGGFRGRQKLFQIRMQRIRTALLELGVTPLLSSLECSCVLQSFKLPPEYDYNSFHDKLKQDGFIIYPGQGITSERMFRISAMGEISDGEIESLIESFRQALTGP